MKASLPAFILLGLTVFFTACKDKNEDFKIEAAPDYYALQAGKFTIYRLDSTVFTQQGRVQETHSYQEKDVVDHQATDGLGRPGWIVYRYIRDTAGLTSWRSTGTYIIIPQETGVEVVENNMRSIRLISPVKEGTTWKGNRFIPADSYFAQYLFGNDDEITDWDFTITGVGETTVIRNKTYSNVVTVQGIDDSFNYPITVTNSFANRTFSVERFARGIGTVYQELVMWEYQPNPNGTPYYIGFGVKRSILDHN
ncbi:MAG: hypothetical protein JWP27_570 [Flaviaesturariibacter sp.]|nr:hypothetical protein [Flaviaesturariibacter sp.]